MTPSAHRKSAAMASQPTQMHSSGNPGGTAQADALGEPKAGPGRLGFEHTGGSHSAASGAFIPWMVYSCLPQNAGKFRLQMWIRTGTSQSKSALRSSSTTLQNKVAPAMGAAFGALAAEVAWTNSKVQDLEPEVRTLKLRTAWTVALTGGASQEDDCVQL